VNGASVFTRATAADVMRAAGFAVPTNLSRLMTCPLHDDATPSFRLFERGWLCFGGCGKGGVADLIIRLGCASDRREAARWLEERIG